MGALTHVSESAIDAANDWRPIWSQKDRVVISRCNSCGKSIQLKTRSNRRPSDLAMALAACFLCDACGQEEDE